MFHALIQKGTKQDLSDEILKSLEEFTYQVYVPRTTMIDIGDVRWCLLTKKQMTGEGLPPTKASLYPAIMTANLQAFQWQQDICQHPVIPSSSNMGWKDVEGHFEPVSCIVSCAPSNILDICRCSCDRGRCALPCSCKSNKLRCTEMCKCSGDEDFCDKNDSDEDSDECDIDSSEDDSDTT